MGLNILFDFAQSQNKFLRNIYQWLFAVLVFACLEISATDPAPDNAAWLRSSELGNAAYNSGNYLQAAKFFQQAKAQAKDQDELEQVYERLIASYLKALRIDDAARELAEYDKKLPNVNADRRTVYQADLLLLQRKYAEAEKLLSGLIEQRAISGNLYFHLLSSLGYAKRMQEKWVETAGIYLMLERAAAGTHWEFIGFRNRLYALIKAGKFEESATLLSAAKRFEKEKDFFDISVLQFILLFEEKKFPEAKEFYAQMRTQSIVYPNSLLYNAQMAVANYFVEINTPLEAIAYLRDAFKSAPSGEDRRLAMRQLVNAYYEGQKTKEAAETAAKYLEFYPNAVDAFEVRMKISQLYVGMEDYNQARKAVDVVINNEKMPMQDRLTAAYQAAIICLTQNDLTATVPLLQFIQKNGLTADQREEASYMLGTAYLKNKHYAQALQVFDASATVVSKWRGRCMLGAVKTQIELKNYQEALHTARKMSEISEADNELEEAMYYSAYILNLLKRPIEAVRAYNALADKYPDGIYAADALFEAGNLYFEIHDYIHTAEMTERFIERFPQHKNAAAALYRLVYANFLNGNTDKALETVQTMKKDFPKSSYTASALFWKVDYLRNHQKNTEAGELLSEMATLFKDNKEALGQILIDRAVVAEIQGKNQEALAFLEEFYTNFIDDRRMPEALFLGGDIASRNSDYTTAMAYYTRCAALNPNSELARAARGRIGDCSSAIYDKNNKFEDLRRAAETFASLLKDPELSHEMNAQTLYKLGVCRSRMNDEDNALQDFNEVITRFQLAIQRGLKLSPAWCIKAAYAAARIYIQRGTPEDANAAIRIFDLMEEMNLNNDGEFNTMRASLKAKYKI